MAGKASFPIDFKYYKWESEIMRPVLTVGISAMMMQIMFFVQQAIVFKSLAHYGDDWHLAFMGACYRILILLILPSFGFSQAFQPIVGINYGAGKYDRVKKSFKVFSVGSSIMVLFVWAWIMFFPTVILSWMLPDADFSTTDLSNLRWMMSTVPLYPVFFLGVTFLQSIGDGKMSGYLLVGRELLLYVPVLLIAPLIFGVDGIYYAGVPNNIIVTVIIFFLMRSQFKKMDQIRDNLVADPKHEVTKVS
jgi:Na+-driven multidrug efflux pump